jgi:hypothetical protein
MTAGQSHAMSRGQEPISFLPEIRQARTRGHACGGHALAIGFEGDEALPAIEPLTRQGDSACSTCRTGCGPV